MKHPHSHIPQLGNSLTTHAPSLAAGEKGQLMRQATYASVTVATLLLLGKLFAWWQTDSLSMLSSFTDSVFDVVMSAINLLAVRYALKPADDDHRFGHSSIEDIAGLAQCAFIFAAMSMILLQSVERLANPHPVLGEPALGIGISIIGIVLTTGLVLFQGFVTRRTKSLVVASDRIHYLGDILFNIGVLAAFVLSSYMGLVWADAAIAIVIVLVVLWSNRTIGIRAFNNLMDREMPDEEKASILAIVKAIPEIRGHHKLKTRYSGTKAFVQLHIEIDAALNFRDAHAITERLEDNLLAQFPGAEVIVHPDPVDRPSAG
jgi:ferrous-iron efflux pump FieF